ncbi:hypothetical protein VTN00DRAFT_7139 [Thermoascus crustaceus]|uniref:uncharacterized protein n=1 Tax=Thermoascus crustaceus TaxID=5088 RepID=UPI00374394C6
MPPAFPYGVSPMAFSSICNVKRRIQSRRAVRPDDVPGGEDWRAARARELDTSTASPTSSTCTPRGISYHNSTRKEPEMQDRLTSSCSCSISNFSTDTVRPVWATLLQAREVGQQREQTRRKNRQENKKTTAEIPCVPDRAGRSARTAHRSRRGPSLEQLSSQDPQRPRRQSLGEMKNRAYKRPRAATAGWPRFPFRRARLLSRPRIAERGELGTAVPAASWIE